MSTARKIHGQLMQLRMRDFAAALGPDMIAVAVAHAYTYQEHPLRRLLMASISPHPNEFASQTLRATADGTRALRWAGWDEWLGLRLATASASDHENAEGALAEIRTAGALLRTEMTVTALEAGGAPRPDLSVSIDGEMAVVETTCKSMNGPEADLLQKKLSQPIKPSPTRVHITEHDVFPAGRPRANECTAENVAQKLAQKKEGARQADGDNPSILWIDLQNESWSVPEHGLQPFIRWHGALYSYGIWHGFYGRKDLPLFEGHIERHGGPFGVFRQRFDGLLIQRPEWSAAVISLPSSTVLYENPWAKNRLGPRIRESLLLVPDADVTASWAQWGSVPLQQVIEAEWERIEYIAKRDEGYLRRQLDGE